MGVTGAVAAGHPDTARAGALVLERGGNAVDAVIGRRLVMIRCWWTVLFGLPDSDLEGTQQTGRFLTLIWAIPCSAMA